MKFIVMFIQFHIQASLSIQRKQYLTKESLIFVQVRLFKKTPSYELESFNATQVTDD